jgi:hypothetical protein
MRKIFFPLLMASVLMPAAANAEPGDRSIRAHGERSESDDNKSQDKPQRAAKPSNDAPRVHVERAERPARVEQAGEANSSEPTRVRQFGNRQDEQVQQVQQAEQVERVRGGERDKDSVARTIRRVGEQRTAQQQQQGTVQVHRDRDGFDGLHDRIVRNGDKVDNKHRWSRDWRKNRHYNWYSYRSRYGSLYRLGRYNDPYGYGYRRFSIGYNLWPSYYGSNHWLNDPWQYRLPPAYGPYRWVRYYDDALLVNIYDGEVADVIRNFFW